MAKTLDDLFNEEDAANSTPEAIAKADADVARMLEKANAEKARMIASGALQPDGEPWPVDEQDEDEDDEDEEL